MIDRNLYSGLIRLHILHHAAEGAIFGQAMIDELGRHGSRLSAGTLYPILMRLTEQKLLETAWEPSDEPGRPPRHLYRLTADGAALAGQRLAARAGHPRTIGPAVQARTA